MCTISMSYSIKPQLDELIGKTIIVVESNNSNVCGIQGKVIDETMHIIVLQTIHKIVRLHKQSITFDIFIDNNHSVRCVGNTIIQHPSERLKKCTY